MISAPTKAIEDERPRPAPPVARRAAVLMTGPHAPQRCLGTVLIDARPEDRFLLKIDAPDGSLAAFAQKPGVRDALITAVKLRRRKRGGYRLKIPPGRHRLLLFAEGRDGGEDKDGTGTGEHLHAFQYRRSRSEFTDPG